MRKRRYRYGQRQRPSQAEIIRQIAWRLEMLTYGAIRKSYYRWRYSLRRHQGHTYIAKDTTINRSGIVFSQDDARLGSVMGTLKPDREFFPANLFNPDNYRPLVALEGYAARIKQLLASPTQPIMRWPR